MKLSYVLFLIICVTLCSAQRGAGAGARSMTRSPSPPPAQRTAPSVPSESFYGPPIWNGAPIPLPTIWQIDESRKDLCHLIDYMYSGLQPHPPHAGENKQTLKPYEPYAPIPSSPSSSHKMDLIDHTATSQMSTSAGSDLNLAHVNSDTILASRQSFSSPSSIGITPSPDIVPQNMKQQNIMQVEPFHVEHSLKSEPIVLLSFEFTSTSRSIFYSKSNPSGRRV